MIAPITHVDLRGYRFAISETGSGAPVIMVHGSVSDHRTWQRQMQMLGRRRVISYSRRYHWPNSPIEEGVDYAMEEQVLDLAALVRHVASAPVDLIGHSYGAYLCLLLAIREPRLVNSMVLAEAPVIPLFVRIPPGVGEIARLMASRPRAALSIMRFAAGGMIPATRAFRQGNRDKGLRLFGEAVLGATTFRSLSAERMLQVQDNLIQEEFLGSGLAPLDWQWLVSIEKPVMLMRGERSPAFFGCLTDRLAELLPNARCCTIPSASHIMHEDNAAAFSLEAEKFLNETNR